MSKKADRSEVQQAQKGQNGYFDGYHVPDPVVLRWSSRCITQIIMSNRTFSGASLKMLIVLVKNGVFPVRMLMREAEMQAFPLRSLRRRLTKVKSNL